MIRTHLAVFAAVIALTGPGFASAGPPEPRKPFDMGRMAGRWYEIARLPNGVNRGCEGSTTDWIAAGGGRFRFTAICRKGAPDGPARTMSGTVHVTDPATHAKVRMSVLGGLVSSDYWLIDHADDYGWLIMGTPNGQVMSIMSAQPTLPAPVRSQVLSLARSLGYDTSRLVFPIQPPGP